MAAENIGIPSITLTMIGFPEMARRVASDAGFPDLRIVEYPGTIGLHSNDTIRKNFEESTFADIVTALTQPVDKSGAQRVQEPGNTDIVFSGTLAEVDQFFTARQWTDGLPITPPTLDRIQEFMKYTDRDPDEVIGILPPRQGAATVWKVAVNGVMAGCRPEYMPILLSIVDIMVDPQFNIQDSGSTPGWEAVIMLNGPIRNQLGFNYREAVMRPGFQPNTSIGRFYRMFLRNVGGFLPGTSDQATFGQNFRVVVPENDEAVHEMGWKTLAERRGFGPDENVITITSCRTFSEIFQPTGDKVEQVLEFAVEWAGRTLDAYEAYNDYEETHILVLSPAIAGFLAAQGYSPTDITDYVKSNLLITAKEFEHNVSRYKFWVPYNLCEQVQNGVFPAEYCTSDDPERLVPLLAPRSDILLLVTGDEKRNRSVFIRQNFKQGYATSRAIKLPSNWDELLAAGN